MEGKDSLNLSLGLNSYGDGEGSSTSEPVMPSGIHIAVALHAIFLVSIISLSSSSISWFFECKNDKKHGWLVLLRTYILVVFMNVHVLDFVVLSSFNFVCFLSFSVCFVVLVVFIDKPSLTPLKLS